MPSYGSVLTVIGAAQIANSQITGIAPIWSAMAVGDGGGYVVTPSAARTALVREVYRGQINTLYRAGDDETQIVAELVIQPQTGGWTLREVGIYDADDNLVVYGSLPEMVKPVLAEGSGVMTVIRARVAVGSGGKVTLKIDPSVVIATRKYVDDKLAAHAGATDAHPLATASIPGFMSPGDKDAFDMTFKGIEAGGQVLHAAPEHPNLTLAAESPVYFEVDGTVGKITAKVRSSVAAAANTMPIADATGLLTPDWGALPPGWVGFFAVDTPPNGFLVCNGAQNLSRTTYARLFGVIGTRYGVGNGTTTFGVPDLRGRVPWGGTVTGQYLNAGLPNITGSFGNLSGQNAQYPAGSARLAFFDGIAGTYSDYGDCGYPQTPLYTNTRTDGTGFDASRSSSVYGSSTTVQPPAVTLLPLIKY